MSDRPRWEVEGRGWPNAAHSRFVEAGGRCWHVQVIGEGPVILLLHGTGAATHSWRGLAPRLAERFTVVAPDLPEHGFTGGGGRSLTLANMAADVAELLLALEKMEPAVIVGHSAGAAIACRLVLDGLVAPKLVVGLNAALLPFPGLAAKLFPSLAKLLFVNPFAAHIFAGIARNSGETGRFLARSTGSRINSEGVALYERLFRRAGHCGAALAMMANWDLESVRHDLPKLGVPLLLVHGGGDAAVPVSTARDAAALVPGARVEVLEGLGHLAHEEAPEEIAALIVAAWEGLE